MPASGQCPGDVVQDGAVNGVDLSAVLSAWGTGGGGAWNADIDGNGVVGGTDLTILLGAWGECSPVPAWATLIEAEPDPAVVYDAALRAAILATGLPWRVRDTATGMRLPTEAEWEYACRGGTTTAYHGWPANPAGSNISSSVGTIAWYNGNNNPFGTKPVGQKSANGFGLHDMSGNVWEFVNDWAVYQYPSGDPQTDPQGPSSGTQRVRRGGGWVENSGYVRSSTRNGRPPDVSGYYDGFRAARTP